VTLVLSLKDGNLALKPLRFGIATGECRDEPGLHGSTRPPAVDADIDFRHIDLKKLFEGMDVPKEAKELAGIVGGYFKLKSKGANEREILARADGQVGLFMEGGQFSHLIHRAPQSQRPRIGRPGMSRATSPSRSTASSPSSRWPRAIATAKAFVFDKTEATVYGPRQHQLRRRDGRDGPRPQHKTPVAVSFRTPIEIRGTFAKPSVHLNPTTLVGKALAAIGLGIALPPAALAPLFNAGMSQDNACGKAFAAEDDKQRVEDNAASSAARRTRRPAASGNSAQKEDGRGGAPAVSVSPKRAGYCDLLARVR